MPKKPVIPTRPLPARVLPFQKRQPRLPQPKPDDELHVEHDGATLTITREPRPPER